MSQQLESYISDLIHLSKSEDNYAQKFDQIVSEISSLEDPASIVLLSQFFDDVAEYDELMFSIIHSIEQFDHVIYINALLAALPSLSQKAPYWCSILLKRVNNSSSAREVLNTALIGNNQGRQLVDSILAF